MLGSRGTITNFERPFAHKNCFLTVALIPVVLLQVLSFLNKSRHECTKCSVLFIQ